MARLSLCGNYHGLIDGMHAWDIVYSYILLKSLRKTQNRRDKPQMRREWRHGKCRKQVSLCLVAFWQLQTELAKRLDRRRERGRDGEREGKRRWVVCGLDDNTPTFWLGNDVANGFGCCFPLTTVGQTNIRTSLCISLCYKLYSMYYAYVCWSAWP